MIKATLILFTLAVLPESQHHGIGRRLIFSFFDFVPSLKRIILTTANASYNRSVQEFYETCGFKEAMILKESNGYVKKLYQFTKQSPNHF